MDAQDLRHVPSGHPLLVEFDDAFILSSLVSPLRRRTGRPTTWMPTGVLVVARAEFPDQVGLSLASLVPGRYVLDIPRGD
jgi:hypothetical protein